MLHAQRAVEIKRGIFAEVDLVLRIEKAVFHDRDTAVIGERMGDQRAAVADHERAVGVNGDMVGYQRALDCRNGHAGVPVFQKYIAAAPIFKHSICFDREVAVLAAIDMELRLFFKGALAPQDAVSLHADVGSEMLRQVVCAVERVNKLTVGFHGRMKRNLSLPLRERKDARLVRPDVEHREIV